MFSNCLRRRQENFGCLEIKTAGFSYKTGSKIDQMVKFCGRLRRPAAPAQIKSKISQGLSSKARGLFDKGSILILSTGLIVYNIKRNTTARTSQFLSNFLRFWEFWWILHYLRLHNFFWDPQPTRGGLGRTWKLQSVQELVTQNCATFLERAGRSL